VATTKLLTADPLTNLPLYPATDSRLHLGNEPTRLPESTVCGSKMQTDFYTIYDSKVDATLVWYGAHLPGFKKTHAYAANRSQDTFYNSEGTLAVSVTGSSGKADENTETYSVVYSRFQPAGLNSSASEKAIDRPQSAKSDLPVTMNIARLREEPRWHLRSKCGVSWNRDSRKDRRGRLPTLEPNEFPWSQGRISQRRTMRAMRRQRSLRAGRLV
jgi:hypothetical protein